MGKLNGYLPPILISSALILPRLHDVQTPNRGQHHGISDPPAECQGSMLSGTQPGIWDALGWWEPHLRSRSDSWVSNQKDTKRIKKGKASVDLWPGLRSAPCFGNLRPNKGIALGPPPDAWCATRCPQQKSPQSQTTAVQRPSKHKSGRLMVAYVWTSDKQENGDSTCNLFFIIPHQYAVTTKWFPVPKLRGNAKSIFGQVSILQKNLCCLCTHSYHKHFRHHSIQRLQWLNPHKRMSQPSGESRPRHRENHHDSEVTQAHVLFLPWTPWTPWTGLKSPQIWTAKLIEAHRSTMAPWIPPHRSRRNRVLCRSTRHSHKCLKHGSTYRFVWK